MRHAKHGTNIPLCCPLLSPLLIDVPVLLLITLGPHEHNGHSGVLEMREAVRIEPVRELLEGGAIGDVVHCKEPRRLLEGCLELLGHIAVAEGGGDHRGAQLHLRG